jgi:outer membrane protein assembly factor BamE (lipoprotein component of BamABCDE complex)
MNRFLFRAFLSSIAIALASCSPIIDTRGHGVEAEDFKQLVAGQSKQDDVQALFGSPSTKSSFGDETWYYITARKETAGIFAPEITEQHVTAIRFDENKAVVDVTDYNKADGKMVQLVSKETPTEGNRMGFMEQMLGNFGRFNAPGRNINPRDIGR